MSSLSTFEDHWDGSRALLGAKYFYEDEEILIATDFECGSGEEILKSEDDTFLMRSETEPGRGHIFEGKSTYFCVGIHNKRKTSRRIRLVISNFTHCLDDTKYITVRQGVDTWSHLPLEDVTAEVFRSIDRHTQEGELRLSVDLPPWGGRDSALFLSPFHWYCYTDMSRYLSEVADTYPYASLESIGKTFQGRDIPVLNIGEKSPDKPRILAVQTLQPSESGHWCCKSIIDYLISEDPEARIIRERNTISLIPHTNPDGTVLGRGMTNSLGQAPQFEGLLASEGQEAARETTLLWNYLKELQPWVYLELHSAYQDWRKKHPFRIYDENLTSDLEVRKLMKRGNDLMLAMPEHEVRLTATHEEDHRTFRIPALKSLNVIPFMLKVHDKFPLKENLEHVLKVFKTLERVKHEG